MKPDRNYASLPLPWLAEFNTVVQTTGSNWRYAPDNYRVSCCKCASDQCSHTCLVKTVDDDDDPYWHRGWHCGDCAWFNTDIGPRARRGAADTLIVAQKLVQDVSNMHGCDNQVYLSYKTVLDGLHKEMIVFAAVYPTIREYTARVRCSAQVYLLLTWLGLPHDAAWPIVALAYWILI